MVLSFWYCSIWWFHPLTVSERLPIGKHWLTLLLSVFSRHFGKDVDRRLPENSSTCTHAVLGRRYLRFKHDQILPRKKLVTSLFSALFFHSSAFIGFETKSLHPANSRTSFQFSKTNSNFRCNRLKTGSRTSWSAFLSRAPQYSLIAWSETLACLTKFMMNGQFGWWIVEKFGINIGWKVR